MSEQSTVEEKLELLEKSLPKKFERKLFFPTINFYGHFYKNPDNGLLIMASEIFDWLGIKPNQCVVQFYNESEIQKRHGPDTAGLYTRIEKDGKETEVILVSSKFRGDPFSAGAILAHEMMHLYLGRKKIALPDTKENEKLTDLATIKTGLSVVVVNGMSYSNLWWLSVLLIFLGFLYWRSQTRATGYFQPGEFAWLAKRDWDERGVKLGEVLNYLNPNARHFVPGVLFLQPKNPDPLVKVINKRRILIRVAEVLAVLIIGSFVVYAVATTPPSTSSTQLESLKSSIEQCRTSIQKMEEVVSAQDAQIRSYAEQLDQYEKNDQIQEYNALVPTYNALVERRGSNYTSYNNRLEACNSLIDQYNASN